MPDDPPVVVAAPVEAAVVPPEPAVPSVVPVAVVPVVLDAPVMVPVEEDDVPPEPAVVLDEFSVPLPPSVPLPASSPEQAAMEKSKKNVVRRMARGYACGRAYRTAASALRRTT
ncbi:MAG: hypothetical protein D6705_01855 [Deltaproteobacteria bacterium]|nr:MAG: hypothetical protein D6705_01855 [Deltaproteobacteria bacterium]